MKFTTKTVITFILLALVVSLLLSTYLSRNLSKAISKELIQREADLVFGAIESGPLAIARLHAGFLAQEALAKLMSNRSLDKRNIYEVSIKGGPKSDLIYATWKSTNDITPKCLEVQKREYDFPDAINPFTIVISSDTCFVLPEVEYIFKWSMIASILAAALSAVSLSFSVWPVTSSIRRAEKFIENISSSTDGISFLPIRDLVIRAKYNAELEKNAAISGIANQVAHDIRSPLSTLNIFISRSSNVSQEEKQLIQEVGKRINGIADDLLSLSKKEKNISAAEVEIISLLTSIFNEKKVLVSEKNNVNFTLDISADDKAINIIFEAIELSRVLSNIINNSFDAVAENGNVEVYLRRTQSEVSLSVVDDGPGIAGDVLSLLKKERVSTKSSKSGSGNGLGLWHANQTVEKYGGRLDISSKVGFGTIVSVILKIS